MHPNWEHWRDLKGTCPVCGKPSHVGASMRTGRYYWLHDDYDIREYYREHGKHSSLAEISFDVFQEMTRCAREHGIEPVATIGGAEAASKRVRCIETGKEYRSIQDARRWELEVAAPRVLGFRASRKPRRKGMGKGAAAPPFPCLFCSRTDRISVLTGQGRSSSCKIWEVYVQSPLLWISPTLPSCSRAAFGALTGERLRFLKHGNLGLPSSSSQQSDYRFSCY